MRRWLALIITVGCFSESDTPNGECTPGDPGCDCTSAGACAQGNECVASIDKCVPTNCTPGSRTCTCADGMQCLGALTCQEGVCLDPPPATSSDPTNASTSPSSTDATATGPMTSSPGTDTVTDTSTPTETGVATEPPLDTGSETIETGSPSTTNPTTSDVGAIDCVQCLIDASTNEACSRSFANCTNDAAPGGCASLYDCATTSGDDVSTCCQNNDATMTGHIIWSSFADCAQDNDCMMSCYLMCPI